jgi:hypothetical protein
MSLTDTRDGASRGKRPFNQAFVGGDGLGSSPKKFSPTPLSVMESSAEATYEDYGDEGALLLVAFANHKKASNSPSGAEMMELSAAPTEERAPTFAPAISEDPARSDSSSETTILSSSRMPDSSSEGDEYEESLDFESDDGLGLAEPSKIGDEENGFSLQRRRAGQHFNKRRHRTSAEQLRVLEMTYAGNKVPNQELRKDLASQLGMTTRRVQIWFQNKRAKEKRLKNSTQLKVHSGAVPSQLAQLTSSMSLSHHFGSPTAGSLPERASFSGLPSSSAAPNSFSAPSRSFSPLAPPTLSGLLGQAPMDPHRMPVAWMPHSPQAMYYPHMMHLPQLPSLPSQAPHQPVLYPNMWSMAPLR